MSAFHPLRTLTKAFESVDHGGAAAPNVGTLTCSEMPHAEVLLTSVYCSHQILIALCQL